MTFDATNFISGLIGAVIGASTSFGVAYIQFRWQRAENERQRQHERALQAEKDCNDRALQAAQERHDKDMQRREANYKRTGIHDPREIGMG